MTRPEAMLIRDVSDPRIAAYVSVRERDLTGRDGRFIVEGKVTLAVLIRRARFAIESLFLSDTRLEPLAGLLSELPADVPVYTAPQALMDEIAGFPIHRGVLACGLKGETVSAGELLTALSDVPLHKQSAGAGCPSLILSEVEGRRGTAPEQTQEKQSTLLVLCGLSNHDNVGAAFRNAAAFGADAVLLDQTSCDPLYRKSIRVSAGTALWLPFTHGGSAADLLTTLEAHKYQAWSLTPHEDAASLSDIGPPKRLAILLGAEGPGLASDIIARTQPVRIPMVPGFDSINVATAGAIALSAVFNRG